VRFIILGDTQVNTYVCIHIYIYIHTHSISIHVYVQAQNVCVCVCVYGDRPDEDKPIWRSLLHLLSALRGFRV